MFWKFDLNTTSHVDKLLDKEDVTLHELMDEDDILQECKAQNRKLLDFICQQQCMEDLVNLITHEPPMDMEEKVRFKYVCHLSFLGRKMNGEIATRVFCATRQIKLAAQEKDLEVWVVKYFAVLVLWHH